MFKLGVESCSAPSGLLINRNLDQLCFYLQSEAWATSWATTLTLSRKEVTCEKSDARRSRWTGQSSYVYNPLKFVDRFEYAVWRKTSEMHCHTFGHVISRTSVEFAYPFLHVFSRNQRSTVDNICLQYAKVRRPIWVCHLEKNKRVVLLYVCPCYFENEGVQREGGR